MLLIELDKVIQIKHNSRQVGSAQQMLPIICYFVAFIWTFLAIGFNVWSATYWKTEARESKLFDKVRHFQGDLEWEAKSTNIHSIACSFAKELVEWGRN